MDTGVTGGDREIDVEVAANVARLRQAAGMSQTALGKAMHDAGQTHWRQNTVSRVESGTQKLTLGELKDLGLILGNVLEGTWLESTAFASETNSAFVRRQLDLAEEALKQAAASIALLRGTLDDASVVTRWARPGDPSSDPDSEEAEPDGDD